MKKNALNWVAKRIKYIFFSPFVLLIAIIIWIEWKRNYDGLPIEAWGMPHPHE